MRGDLRLFEQPRGGDWKIVAGPFPVLFGKNGLAWGTGISGQNEPGLRKKERDGRAPAGIFAIGQVFGYDAHLPAGADYPYHQVTDADIWSDDPRSPNYNRHIVIDPKNPPEEIMVQWHSSGWAHRAYWGEDKIRLGNQERMSMGALPEAGKWVRLEMKIADVSF